MRRGSQLKSEELITIQTYYKGRSFLEYLGYIIFCMKPQSSSRNSSESDLLRSCVRLLKRMMKEYYTLIEDLVEELLEAPNSGETPEHKNPPKDSLNQQEPKLEQISQNNKARLQGSDCAQISALQATAMPPGASQIEGKLNPASQHLLTSSVAPQQITQGPSEPGQQVQSSSQPPQHSEDLFKSLPEQDHSMLSGSRGPSIEKSQYFEPEDHPNPLPPRVMNWNEPPRQKEHHHFSSTQFEPHKSSSVPSSILAHRHQRTFTAASPTFIIKNMSTVKYTPREGKPDLVSYFTHIWEPNPKVSDVLYHVFNSTSKSDFSHQSKPVGEILFFKALKNREPNPEKENAIILIAQTSALTPKTNQVSAETSPEYPKQQKVSFASISTARNLLKPLFELSLIQPETAARLIKVRQFAEHSTEFELLLVVEENKVLYSKNECEEGWFSKLVDTHRIALLEKQSKQEKLSLAFDAARRAATRFLVFSRAGDQYHFQVFSVRLDATAARVAPEFYFEHELRGLELLQTASEWKGHYSDCFFDSNVGVVGAFGLFDGGIGEARRYQLKFAVLDCLQLTEKAPGDDAGDFKNTKLILPGQSSDFESVDERISFVASDIEVFIQDVAFIPRVKWSEASFEYKGNDYYLMIYGVTGTNKLFFFMIDANRVNHKLKIKSHHIELGPAPAIISKAAKPAWSQYLSTISDSIYIVESPKKLTATVTVAYENATTFDAELDLTQYF